jgi:hydroxypyruvate isomerase
MLAAGRNLRRAADRAAKAGVMLCIEVTNPAYLPGMLIESLDDAVRLIDALNHPAVKLMFDVGHLAMNGENIPAIIKIHAHRIGAVQVADVAKDGATRVDLGAGKLDWPPILKALRTASYGGLLEIEHQPLDDSRDGELALLARLRAIDARS